MSLEILGTPGDVDSLQDAWSDLFQVTPEASGFQSHAWVASCAGRVAGSSRALHVAAVRSNGRIVAIFPGQLDSGGRLELLGADVSNYAGPVFDPAHLGEAVDAWGLHLRGDPRVKAVDLQGLRSRSPFTQLLSRQPLPGWGRAVTAVTNTCPEVDLSRGWSALLERHKSKQRSTWRRKESRLGRLGNLAFVETADPESIARAMPRMAELWTKRWEGQRIQASFAKDAQFQLKAAGALAENNLALVSSLQLDGEIIAFAYGVRGLGFTSSYVLAHDGRLSRYSPGLLLLLHVLEAACLRGDSLYDFSLGDASYKALWVTQEQEVYRALWGRNRHLRAGWSAAWTRARSVDRLRRLKLGGWRAAIGRPSPPADVPDQPGLPAGATSTTFVYRLNAPTEATGLVRRCTYEMMREQLSPRLFRLALERNFRGDDLLAVEDGTGLTGVVWAASRSRRAALTGGELEPPDTEVYYHPVALPGRQVDEVVGLLPGAPGSVIVTNAQLSTSHVSELRQVAPDPATWSLQSPNG